MKSLLTIVLGLLVLQVYGEEKPAKEIAVAYLFNDAHPFNLQEIGASASATLEDTLTMKVMLASSKETKDDSRWTFHSVDSLGSEIRAWREGDGTLKTEGQYVFVTGIGRISGASGNKIRYWRAPAILYTRAAPST